MNKVMGLISDVEFVRSKLPSDFVVEQRLARGGQGIIYRGDHNGQKAAIKIYFPGQLARRIGREVEALQALTSPNLVGLLWDGNITVEDYVLPVVATELVDGTVLNERLQSSSLTAEELTKLMAGVARAIQCLWSRRIVHRDLKPSNIMLRDDCSPCVIDLGLARHLEHSSLTAVGATWGTLGYLSPEQSRGVRNLTCKSDIYALGVIVLESALGRHPANGDQGHLQALDLHENLPLDLGAWVGAGLLKRCLHPSPPRRPLPAELVEQLR